MSIPSINVTISSVESGVSTITIPKSINYNELIECIVKEHPDLKDVQFSLFISGKPLESNSLTLNDNDHIVLVTRIKQVDVNKKIFEKSQMQSGDIQTDEPNLNQQEINQIFDVLEEQQKNDVLILTEIGFDQQTAFNAYCMSAGNNDVAVEMLLNGLRIVDFNLITVFICNKYPNAVRQVRPKLLSRKRGFATPNNNNNQRMVEDFLFQTLMAGGRLQDIVQPLREEYEEEDDESDYDNFDLF
ncbi:UBA domain-containing protein [Entamoeba marina]